MNNFLKKNSSAVNTQNNSVNHFINYIYYHFSGIHYDNMILIDINNSNKYWMFGLIYKHSEVDLNI